MAILNLPPAPVARWTPQRKAAIVSAIKHGALTYATAFKKYGIDGAEIARWIALFEQGNVLALKATNVRSVPRPRV